jgi:phospholipase C
MMRDKRTSRFLYGCRLGLSALALGQFSLGPVLAQEVPDFPDHRTQTPIKHVIVIIGENRSFDHVFASYVPRQPGQSVTNLLSQGIIQLDSNKNAHPGPNFQKAHQLAAQDLGSTESC